ncbi:MAG: hypothetical protein COB67_09425 [SAR324 cluster bacterium]|uniref:Chemotaxis protein CheV n=1 Tax=SAR324 cluster bacterium TaxID=2024889 RepID=A0A2A4T105_9DELT|nr:MAG: hypothetical protein COB67_09425 [SAR324 cluster bacterium]
MASQEILLDSGTNEVELLEFYLGGQSFGINVEKIKQIVKFDTDSMTRLPNCYPSLMGTYPFQEFLVPLIDLNKHLNRTQTQDFEQQIVLVCEFNNAFNCFLVDGVNKIHRLSWSEIHGVPPTLLKHNSRLVGIYSIQEKEVLLLDFEKIIIEIKQQNAIEIPEKDEHQERFESRQNIRLMLVDDSIVIRKLVKEFLVRENYKNINTFENGAAAYQELIKLRDQGQKEGQDLSSYLDLIVTDVEMPEMDGLTLCRKIKEDFPQLPVLIFSSLVNAQIINKCNSVGASGCINKQNPAELLGLIDQLVLQNSSPE